MIQASALCKPSETAGIPEHMNMLPFATLLRNPEAAFIFASGRTRSVKAGEKS